MDGREAIKRLEKQYKRQNDYIKNSYDRVSITLPKGTKDRIKATGNSINGIINTLVLDWLEDQERTGLHFLSYIQPRPLWLHGSTECRKAGY